MNDIKLKNEPFLGFIPKGGRAYHSFIRLVFRHADSICFTVRPFLDGIGEFNSSIWSGMQYSVLDYGFAGAASDFAGDKSHLVLLRADYPVYEFLQGRNGVFDFHREDPELGITLEDPAFIRDGEAFCYTVTHEKICIATEKIYKQLCAGGKF